MTDRPEHHLHPIGDSLGQEADALMNPEGTVEVPPAEQMSLIRRLRQPRTMLSIAVPLAVIVVAIIVNRDKLAEVPADVSQADLRLILLGFLVYYLGFPLRGRRWTLLLHGAGYRISTRDGTEILFLSWLVNCVVPAKLGDVYRAYLLKLNTPVSLTKTLGTVFIERILDLFAIALLGLAAGYIHFRDGLPGQVQLIFAFGVALIVLLALALIGMRNFGRRLVEALPLPHRAEELYYRFEEGVFQSVGLRGLPWLGVLTVLIWVTEGLRLYFVIQAFGFANLHLGLSGTMFVALCGSLLTAVPLTPGGLGFVEAGGVGLLTTVFGMPLPQASAVILVDRAISVFSIVVLGSIAYVISSKPRGGGMKIDEVAMPPVTAN
ncbi:MAG: lysylphosphatidylglycerol synthase transmembrane domain-containing protein [Candidatus Limnocylindrales bacterium]